MKKSKSNAQNRASVVWLGAVLCIACGSSKTTSVKPISGGGIVYAAVASVIPDSAGPVETKAKAKTESAIEEAIRREFGLSACDGKLSIAYSKGLNRGCNENGEIPDEVACAAAMRIARESFPVPEKVQMLKGNKVQWRRALNAGSLQILSNHEMATIRDDGFTSYCVEWNADSNELTIRLAEMLETLRRTR